MIFVVIGGVFVASLFIPRQAHALGISPSTYHVDNIRVGESVPVDFTITTSSLLQQTQATVSFTGSAADALLGEERIVIDAGERRIAYSVTIDASDLSPGQYTAGILVKEDSTEESDATGARVELAVPAELTFTVTDERIKVYEVTSARLEYTDSLSLIYGFDNTGNVGSTPAGMDIALTAKSDGTVYEGYVPQSDFPSVASHMQEEVTVPIELDISPGLYTARMTFHGLEGQEYTFEQDHLQISGDMQERSSNNIWYVALASVLGIVLIGGWWKLYRG